MGQVRVPVDDGIVDKSRLLLKRHGFTLTSFLRKSLLDFMAENGQPIEEEDGISLDELRS